MEPEDLRERRADGEILGEPVRLVAGMKRDDVLAQLIIASKQTVMGSMARLLVHHISKTEVDLYPYLDEDHDLGLEHWSIQSEFYPKTGSVISGIFAIGGTMMAGEDEKFRIHGEEQFWGGKA